MTRDELTALMDELAPVLREFSTAITTRLVALEERAAEPGPPGPKGEPGRDGRDGQPGLMGIPGADGKDGMSIDDFNMVLEDERTLTVTLSAGDQIQKKSVTPPWVLDRGVYKAGTAYVQGDGVTWGGSFWIAQRDTSGKPGDGDSGWRLAVKAGRDGREGKPGPQGEKGLDGRAGKDLTQLGFDGKKY